MHEHEVEFRFQTTFDVGQNSQRHRLASNANAGIRRANPRADTMSSLLPIPRRSSVVSASVRLTRYGFPRLCLCKSSAHVGHQTSSASTTISLPPLRFTSRFA